MKFVKILFITMLLLGWSGVSMPSPAHSKAIQWRSLKDAMASSKSENKKILVYFYAEWCATCKKMKKETFKDPGVIRTLNNTYIPVKVDVDKNKKLSEIFKISLLPDTWFMTENNEIIGNRPGYISAEQLKALLKMFAEDNY